MNWADIDDLAAAAKILESVATVVALGVAALWASYRFDLFRESYPKIEFDLDLRYLGPFAEGHHVELTATIANHGTVRHLVRKLEFDLRVLPKNKLVEDADEKKLKQTNFTVHLRKDQPILPESMRISFVDPGVSQDYRYITRVPADTDLILVIARFKYKELASEFHKAQRTWSLPILAKQEGFGGAGDR